MNATTRTINVIPGRQGFQTRTDMGEYLATHPAEQTITEPVEETCAEPAPAPTPEPAPAPAFQGWTTHEDRVRAMRGVLKALGWSSGTRLGTDRKRTCVATPQGKGIVEIKVYRDIVRIWIPRGGGSRLEANIRSRMPGRSLIEVLSVGGNGHNDCHSAAWVSGWALIFRYAPARHEEPAA